MRLERILSALFWLPICLGGAVSIALVEPKYSKIGIISAVALCLFLILALLQAILEHSALPRRAVKEPTLSTSRTLAMTEDPAITGRLEELKLSLRLDDPGSTVAGAAIQSADD